MKKIKIGSLEIFSWALILFWLYIIYLGNRPNYELPGILQLPLLILPIISFILSIIGLLQKKSSITIFNTVISLAIIIYLLVLYLQNNFV